MNPQTIMVVAGDPSGDANAADLVKILAEALPGARFIGAGGPKMAAAGVQLSFNLTDDAVIGPADVFKKLGLYWRRLQDLIKLAKAEQPGLIILVDFYAFNRQIAHAIKKQVRATAHSPASWQPKIVQYTSPQVWASRPWRAEKLAKDIDLLLCLFPFEKEWYARRGIKTPIEFVGHPMFDRHALNTSSPAQIPTVVLLPGSREGELRRHLPVMLAAARLIGVSQTLHFKLVASNEALAAFARSFAASEGSKTEIQIGGLAEALSTATVAIASTGTVTMECAYFGVPTVALYKTSPFTYFLGRRLVTVKYLAMPNILADEPLFPEFIQHEATAENIARAALELLSSPVRRTEIQNKLRLMLESLGGPGATRRAASAILQAMNPPFITDNSLKKT